jgi:hypothetical protein
MFHIVWVFGLVITELGRKINLLKIQNCNEISADLVAGIVSKTNSDLLSCKFRESFYSVDEKEYEFRKADILIISLC